MRKNHCADGKTPVIKDGFWWIGDTNTGVKAQGEKGDSGRDGVDGKTPVIKNGTWWIGDTNTGVAAAGTNGTNGLSAYELWKADLALRCNTAEAFVDYKNGGTWNCEKNTLADFYEYLRGKDGKDGKDGQDGRPGIPGQPGAEVKIILGVPNVVAQYSQSEFGEYVRTTDGGVLYKVYDEKGELAPGAKVKGMPGVAENKVYTADQNGEFIVPREDLPEIQELERRWGTVKEVTLPGKSAPQVSAQNTYVPNRVHLRMLLRGPLLRWAVMRNTCIFT